MSTLKIGKVGRRNFTLPLEVATQAMAVHGVRGKGKTVTATVVVEELLSHGIQVAIIDPTDVWFGLRSSGDGKSDGHPVVVLGGPHADLPLQEDSGSIIADFVVDHGASVVLSLRHLRKNAQRRFVTDFAEQLYHRKGEVANRTPLFLAIDEASQFVPQRVMGDTARMVGAIQDIVRLGRHAGLGVALIDQRPASVNKDVLTQIEVLVCHAVTSPQDRKALDDWIRQKDSAGHRDEFLEHLASLPRGEAWFWFPIADVFERVAVRMRQTFDSSKTPEIGEQPVAPEARAEIDLDELRAHLEETIAEAEANDPRTLKARIAELERELRNGAREETEDRRLEIVEERDRYVMAALAKQREGFAQAAQPLLTSLSRISGDVDNLIGDAEELAGLLQYDDGDVELIDAGDASSPTPRGRRPSPSALPTRPVPLEVAEGLSPRHQRILDALARLEAMGIGAPSRSVLAAVAKYSPKSSGFEKAVSRLSSLELVRYPSAGDVALTPEGRALAAPPDRAVSLQELQDAWFRILEPRHVRILNVLIDVYPDDLSRDELAEQSEYSPLSSGYEKAISRLSSFGLVRYPKPGHVVATELLFPPALTYVHA